MEECEELLYNDPKKLRDKKECFLSEDHYYRAMLALLFESKKVGKYMLFNANPFVYVLGIDDSTEKIFSRRLNISPRLLKKNLTEGRLRALMGFTHHKWEVNGIRSKQIIRLQGDLAMKVEKAFSSLDKMLNYLSYFPGFNFDIRSPLWREFIMKKFAGDKELGMIQKLIDVLNELRTLRDEFYINDSEELISLRKELSKTIKEKLGEKKVPTIDKLYLERVYEKREEFKKFVLEKEERLKLTYGHYLSPHLVQVVGVLSSSDDMVVNQRNVRIFVLREQDIIITHEEHGTTTFKMNRPAIVQFGTLDEFSSPFTEIII